MTDIAPNRINVQQEAVRYRSAVSEGILSAVGGSINFINDYQLLSRDFYLNGPYNIVATPQTFVDGQIFFPTNVTIVAVYMFCEIIGSGGTTELDIKYTNSSAGSFSTIFSTLPQITSTATGNGAYCYYNGITNTSSAPTGTTAPVLGITDLNANSTLRMDILSAMTGTVSGTGIVLFYRPRN